MIGGPWRVHAVRTAQVAHRPRERRSHLTLCSRNSMAYTRAGLAAGRRRRCAWLGVRLSPACLNAGAARAQGRGPSWQAAFGRARRGRPPAAVRADNREAAARRRRRRRRHWGAPPSTAALCGRRRSRRHLCHNTAASNAVRPAAQRRPRAAIPRGRASRARRIIDATQRRASDGRRASTPIHRQRHVSRCMAWHQTDSHPPKNARGRFCKGQLRAAACMRRVVSSCKTRAACRLSPARAQQPGRPSGTPGVCYLMSV